MRAFVAAAAAMTVWLSGCNSTPESPATAAAKTEAAAAPTHGQVHFAAEAQQRQGIAVETIEERSLPETIRVNGRVTINENRTWRVGAVTEGRIVRVFVNVGDRVREGQVIARLHTHDVHENRAMYRRAQMELARLRSAEAYAQRVRDRTKRLLDLRAASVEQLDAAETELRNAQSAIAQAEVEVERARIHLEEFLGVPAEEPEHHGAGQHDGDEDLVPVRAPAAGVVLQRNVTQGTVVQQSGELFVVSDTASLWMIASVPEDRLGRLRTGMPARVSVQAYPDRNFAGRITRLDEQLDPTTRTVNARVELPNPQGLLKPEMYAIAEIELPATRAAILVPETALQEVGGALSVFVQRDPENFQAVAVETGPRQGGRVEIFAGLRPGDRVVTSGSFMLKSHMMRAALAEEE
jgi:membrane fusion protein, heavy metal efflux system